MAGDVPGALDRSDLSPALRILGSLFGTSPAELVVWVGATATSAPATDEAVALASFRLAPLAGGRACEADEEGEEFGKAEETEEEPVAVDKDTPGAGSAGSDNACSHIKGCEGIGRMDGEGERATRMRTLLFCPWRRMDGERERERTTRR